LTQNYLLTNNFNEKEFILDDMELHKELDLSLFNCGSEKNTTNFNEEVNNNKNYTNVLLTKNINFSEISEIFKKIEQNTKNYVWLESYDEILNNFCEREFGCSVEEELDLSLFNLGQEDKKNLDNFIFCENINFYTLSEIFNKNLQNKKKTELINNFCEKEFNCDVTKRDFSLFDLSAFVDGEYIDDCMWDFCTFLSSNTNIFYNNLHESSLNFNEIFKKSNTLLKDFEYKNCKIFNNKINNFISFTNNCVFCDESCWRCSINFSSIKEFNLYYTNFLKKIESLLKKEKFEKPTMKNNFNFLKIEKNCCFCEDLCKLCSIYLKNIDEFENIEEYSKYFDTFFEDVSEFVKNNKENKNCFDGVCEINFEDKESGIYEKNESFDVYKNNFLKNYENNFKNEIFFKNFIFSNNEENSRLSKNFFGKKKIFFLIKKDIKKINFLEKNFFFKIRFNDKNSNFNNKNSSNSTYFTFKQKRYKRRTQIQKFLKNYKNIENKDLIFNGFLNLNEDNVLDDNIKNPTKYYRMLRKNRLRGEDMPVSISKRLLRVKKTLVIPTNINITAITNSYDVVHSWFIPGIGLKMDCVPGRSTHHTFYVDNAGFYYGQCAEICGRYHHHMPIRVCALPFEHFLIW
jgi:heme/copper-type cytochrome/quinol oxidase subunit 2